MSNPRKDPTELRRHSGEAIEAFAEEARQIRARNKIVPEGLGALALVRVMRKGGVFGEKAAGLKFAPSDDSDSETTDMGDEVESREMAAEL